MAREVQAGGPVAAFSGGCFGAGWGWGGWGGATQDKVYSTRGCFVEPFQLDLSGLDMCRGEVGALTWDTICCCMRARGRGEMR